MHIAHKVLSGGVIGGIMTTSQARIAFRKLQHLDTAVLFQQSIHSSHEVIIGAKRDTQFGTFLTVGLGGSFTNAIEDRQYAFLPAQKSVLNNILKSSKLFHTIKHDPNLVNQVISGLVSTQSMLLNQPEIKEFEINPLMLTKNKGYAVDIKITLTK